jgi:hypothetical protein
MTERHRSDDPAADNITVVPLGATPEGRAGMEILAEKDPLPLPNIRPAIEQADGLRALVAERRDGAGPNQPA